MDKLVRPRRRPSGCIDEHPTRYSISLGGVWVNLSAISRSQSIDKSYLSRIFSGERPNITVPMLRRIANAVGFTLDELDQALLDRWALIAQKKSEAEIKYLTRIIDEDTHDIETLRKGRAPKPRQPAERYSPSLDQVVARRK